ncbi:MAG: hypothetical protein H6607_00215 [Flavobacteriales bacterium]|nr:hypothetical protein [Flavobacteriales bacterium]
MFVSFGVRSADNPRLWDMGLHINTNGFGLGSTLRLSENRMIDVDFSSFKHQRESKVVNHNFENKLPFVFGKLYHTGNFRITYGVSKNLIQKQNQGDVTVDLRMSAGLAIATLRPVYLRLAEFDGDKDVYHIVKYTPENVPSTSDVVGYAHSGYGWDEINYKPGLTSKTGIALTWQNPATLARSIGVGTNVNYFPKGLNIMAFEPTQYLFVSGYIEFKLVFNSRN